MPNSFRLDQKDMSLLSRLGIAPDRAELSVRFSEDDWKCINKIIGAKGAPGLRIGVSSAVRLAWHEYASFAYGSSENQKPLPENVTVFTRDALEWYAGTLEAPAPVPFGQGKA